MFLNRVIFFGGIFSTAPVYRAGWRCACSGCSSPGLSCKFRPIFLGIHPANQRWFYPTVSHFYSNLGSNLSIQHHTRTHNDSPMIFMGNMMIHHWIWPRSFFSFLAASGIPAPGGTDECCCLNLCIWSFILVPSALYFAFVAPSLVANGIYLLPGGVDCWRIWPTMC